MKGKFIFDIRKCVACRACSVACKIRNQWNISAREIFTSNPEAITGLPVVSISMACNHCQDPACLDSCPSRAISRDEETGAVILEPSRCLGCKYCSWNCPFDAPKFNETAKIMEKCNLCYQAIKVNEDPACANACPTGALSYGIHEDADFPKWMSFEKLGPSVILKGLGMKSPEIIPSTKSYDTGTIEKSKKSEWSLIIFTILSVFSVSFFITSCLKSQLPGIVPLSAIIIAGIFSLFHLGRPLLSWRSVLNFRSSGLSREIAAYLFYSICCLTSLFIPSDLTVISGCLAGIILMTAIDRVYSKVDEKALMHSGQVLLMALGAIPFFSGGLLPLLFIAVIRFLLSVLRMVKDNPDGYLFFLRFVRLSFLVISVAGVSSGLADNLAAGVLYIAGELIDRFLFYQDFNTPFFMTGIHAEKELL